MGFFSVYIVWGIFIIVTMNQKTTLQPVKSLEQIVMEEPLQGLGCKSLEVVG